MNLIDEQTVRRFLELLHSRAAAALSHIRRPGVLQLVSVSPDDRGLTTSAFNIGDVDSMLAAPKQYWKNYTDSTKAPGLM